MSDGENDNFSRELSIDDAEGKLPEDVFSKISEVDWPAPGSFSDSFNRLLEGGFEVERRDEATISVPSQ
jgi:hypothetical protein